MSPTRPAVSFLPAGGVGGSQLRPQQPGSCLSRQQGLLLERECLKLVGINCPWCSTQSPCQEADSSRGKEEKDFFKDLNRSLRDVAFSVGVEQGTLGVWRWEVSPWDQRPCF